MPIASMARKFRSNVSGSVSLMFGLSAIILMMILGVAIDSARYQDLSSRTQSALDGASLAAAKLLEDEALSIAEIQDRAIKYFEAAKPTFGIQTSYISPLSVAIDRDNSSVEAGVQMRIPSFFGRFAGGSGTVTMNRTSKVVYDMQKIELALVLDVTGSMGDKNKIGDMKQAAADVIETLLDNSINENNTRIALAPFSASVNAGTYRGTIADTTGAVSDACVIERDTASEAPPSGAQKLKTMSTATVSPNYSCPTVPIVPLSGKSQKQSLIDTVNLYQAGGSTAAHIGTAWGWYLLSPQWSGVFGSSAPNPYDPKKVIKAAVIMTDGDFNQAYANGLNGSNGDATHDAAVADFAYAQFQSLCTGMKDQGIRVFTIGYDLADGSRPMTELETCATAGDFYAAAAGNLKKVFEDIAATLTALRVSG